MLSNNVWSSDQLALIRCIRPVNPIKLGISMKLNETLSPMDDSPTPPINLLLHHQKDIPKAFRPFYEVPFEIPSANILAF